ncbi:NAD-dependent epimerase/dehydratase family protein [Salinibacterium sp. PAMC 21357]|uniref:NAD-dependent epimerase/dehydratase family protein n=1 Tax=Salinibacterium sp. PAMC 21357 TaxID=1112215 RepID=UPI00028919AE|nr:NAD(P)-dependent oxidoreductase [Salinibacterium sp. PAMC 21357]
MKVAVTGASGFVGGAIATALTARGHDVLGFGRSTNGWSGRYERWDLTSGVRAPEATANPNWQADAVIHCAALADDWASREQAFRVNVSGTRTVVESFPDARIIHISSSSVYDAFTPTVHATEDAAPPTTWLSTYSESKAAAELEVGSAAVILRPHAVYGPGDTTLLPRILAGFRGRRLILPAGAAMLHTLTHIDNLVDAAELSLTGSPGIYNIGDDGDVLLSEILTELLAKQGRADVALASIPYSVAWAAAATIERLYSATGRGPGSRRGPRLTRYAVSQLGRERTLDLSAARRELGYSPRATTLEGCEDW